MDMIGYASPDTNVESVKASGPYKVVINLKTVDSQFIAANLNLQFVVPKHIWSKVADPATFTNPNPVGSGPFNEIGRFTTQDYVFNKNPHYWLAGAPKIPCLEYTQAVVERLRAARDPERPGRLDAQLRPERRAGVHRRRTRRTTTRSTRRRRIRSRSSFDDTQYPYSIVAFRKALSLAINRSDVSKLGEYGYAPPTDALGLNGIFPTWVQGGACRPRRKRPRPTTRRAAKKLLTDAGFTYKGSNADRPEGQSRQPRHPRDLGLVGLGRVEPDHHEEPPGDRHQLERRARARLELVVSERVVDEEPDPALADRLAGVAVRLLPTQPVAELKFTPFRPGCDEHRELGALSPTRRRLRSSTSGRRRSTRRSSSSCSRSWRTVFLPTQPIVPLFVGPRWSTYSTKYFHCFTSPKNFYGDPIFTTAPDNILSFTRICPGGKAGA